MLLWIDGFENYGTSYAVPSPTGIVGRKYLVTDESTMRVAAGRITGSCLGVLTYSNASFGLNNLTTNATVVLGFAFQPVNNLVNTGVLVKLLNGATIGITLTLTIAGEFLLTNGAGGTLGTTVGANIRPNKWSFVELKIQCGASGTYEIRVDGISVLSGTGVTRNGVYSYHDGFALVGSNNNLIVYYDDLYFLDASGTANNTFLGNVRAITLRPSASGDLTQFTPDSGTNYARVNEAICGDDSNYVESATTTQSDLYNYADSVSIPADIKGIQINTDVRETDVTNWILQNLCKSGGTSNNSANITVATTSYVTRSSILETDPNTSNAWTVTSVNAAQFGIKVI